MERASEEWRDLYKKMIYVAIANKFCAYAPYSQHCVGAALLAENERGHQKLFYGHNIENASYSLTVCAERVAAITAIMYGYRKFKVIVCVTDDGTAFPCGACRQFLNEFNDDLKIIMKNSETGFINTISMSTILPYAFGPQHLLRD